jgi:hypothetical protein
MLLSYVDFFSGPSSETPEKTRISTDERRNYSSTKKIEALPEKTAGAPKMGQS